MRLANRLGLSTLERLAGSLTGAALPRPGAPTTAHLDDLCRVGGPSLAGYLNGPAGARLEQLIAGLRNDSPAPLACGAAPALRGLVQRMAQAAPAALREEVAPFLQALSADSRRALFEAALTHLQPNELSAFARFVGRSGMRLLALGQSAVEPTLLREMFGRNVTERVKELYATGCRPAPRGSDDCVFVFGRGLFGNQAPGYFNVNQQAVGGWLRGLHQLKQLRYDTAAESERNAASIRSQVQDLASTGKPIILIGHSKFGLDLRLAFSLYPELESMVTGVLLFQPVSTASLAASIDGSLFGKTAQQASRWMFGSAGAVQSLAARACPQAWPENVPTVVVATSAAGSGIFSPIIAGLHNRGVSTDGALALAEQVGFAGADVAVFPGLSDHMALVLEPRQMLLPAYYKVEEDKPSTTAVDPRVLTRAALTALFETIAHKKLVAETSLRARATI